MENGNDIKNGLTGLPISELIGNPLIAASKAQFSLAETALTFINKIGFIEKDGKRQANLLEFKIQQPIISKDGTGDGKITYTPVDVQAPMLGLVPLPSLLIEDVSVDFQMEISTSTASKEEDKSEAELKAGVSAGWGWGKASVEFTGKVSSSRENTRSTNQTAKYNVRVNARQQQQTEGLSKLMDIMAACITPIDVK
jgi:hypothetical protein